MKKQAQTLIRCVIAITWTSTATLAVAGAQPMMLRGGAFKIPSGATSVHVPAQCLDSNLSTPPKGHAFTYSSGGIKISHRSASGGTETLDSTKAIEREWIEPIQGDGRIDTVNFVLGKKGKAMGGEFEISVDPTKPQFVATGQDQVKGINDFLHERDDDLQAANSAREKWAKLSGEALANDMLQTVLWEMREKPNVALDVLLDKRAGVLRKYEKELETLAGQRAKWAEMLGQEGSDQILASIVADLQFSEETTFVKAVEQNTVFIKKQEKNLRRLPNERRNLANLIGDEKANATVGRIMLRLKRDPGGDFATIRRVEFSGALRRAGFPGSVTPGLRERLPFVLGRKLSPQDIKTVEDIYRMTLTQGNSGQYAGTKQLTITDTGYRIFDGETSKHFDDLTSACRAADGGKDSLRTLIFKSESLENDLGAEEATVLAQHGFNSLVDIDYFAERGLPKAPKRILVVAGNSADKNKSLFGGQGLDQVERALGHLDRLGKKVRKVDSREKFTAELAVAEKDGVETWVIAHNNRGSVEFPDGDFDLDDLPPRATPLSCSLYDSKANLGFRTTRDLDFEIVSKTLADAHEETNSDRRTDAFFRNFTDGYQRNLTASDRRTKTVVISVVAGIIGGAIIEALGSDDSDDNEDEEADPPN